MNVFLNVRLLEKNFLGSLVCGYGGWVMFYVQSSNCGCGCMRGADAGREVGELLQFVMTGCVD